MYRRIKKTDKPYSKPNQKYARVSLLMSDDEKQRLWERANEANLGLCELIRQSLFGEDYRKENKESEVNE